VANTQKRSVVVVGAICWNCRGFVVQVLTGWQVASDVSVAAVAVNVLVPSQVVTVAHTRSSNAVGAALWYWVFLSHAALISAQTRFEVLVGASDSYCSEGLHTVRAVHALLLVVVAGVDSYSYELQVRSFLQ